MNSFMDEEMENKATTLFNCIFNKGFKAGARYGEYQARIKELEKKQKEAGEIKVGDEVTDDIGTIAIVTRISGEEVCIVCGDGSAGLSKKKDFKKTGRSFPQIEEALKQMKEKE